MLTHIVKVEKIRNVRLEYEANLDGARFGRNVPFIETSEKPRSLKQYWAKSVKVYLSLGSWAKSLVHQLHS